MPSLLPISVFVAAQRIATAIRHTELRHSRGLSSLGVGQVHLKLENQQVTGSFKIRGALNVISSLPDEARKRGVVAASAGNHGLGVAHAASAFGIPTTIFVPASAPAIKRDGIAALGAEVIAEAASFDEARRDAEAEAERSGRVFIHPCEGEVLIAGQGTVGLEILQELPQLATLIVPVGGAGLVAGIASLVRAVAPHVRIVGVQTEHTDAVARALDAGHPVQTDGLLTLAEGLAGDADAYALELARFAVDEMVVVSEEDTARAIAWLSRNERLTVEGSAAVGVAALLSRRVEVAASPVAVVLTGANIDEEKHARIVAEFGENG